MFKNYFTIAWRNLYKNKVHSFVNIIGLALGMAVALQIGLWMFDELSFNRNFEHYDRIAQVIQNVTNNNEVQTWTNVPFPLAEEIRKNYGSDFKRVILVSGPDNQMVSYGDKKITQQVGYFEKGAADMFSLKMLKGNRNGINDPSSVFLSSSTALSYFGKDDPINRILKIDNRFTVKVAGVYEDFPRNSTFDHLNVIGNWDMLYNQTDWLKQITDPWRPNAFTLFVELNEHADLAAISLKIKDAKLKRVNSQLAKKKPALFLFPMSKWHLYSEFKDGVNTGGDIQYVWMFSIIGSFVLLLACINFMNLSTAQSGKRAKEIGIRKTVGSLRKQLIIQFFTESFLTTLFAFILSIGLVWISLPFFNEVAGKSIVLPLLQPYFWMAGLLFTFLTAIIAGSYPSFYLSSFRPVKVLKGTFKAGKLATLPRKILVVIQFTVSVTLITGTIIVYRQIQFAKDRPVGYSRDGLISINQINNNIHNHLGAFRNALIESGAVVSVTEAGAVTTSIGNSTSGIDWPGKDPNLSVDFAVASCSIDYGTTIKWHIKEGRDFSKDFLSDSTAVILNEAAAQFMGMKHPVGETISWWGKPYKIVGLVNDMIMRSPYDETRPVVYNLLDEGGSVVILRTNPSISSRAALEKIAPIYKKFNPDQPFEYDFVDALYAEKFGNEERIGKLAGFFAALAIIISCLGLFGLTAFVTEQRRKEIGMRKVLGASVLNVWNLLSADFVKLIIISFLIAFPVSWYLMFKWLQNYHYHAAISWWIFLLAGSGALAITVCTVSFHAIKAAMANPVKSLRAD